MRVQVLKTDLSKLLSVASRFVNTRAQLPVLGNLVLSADKTKLTAMATNLENSFVSSIGAKVEESGDIAVPARTITELVTNLNPGTVDLETKKEQLAITSENFSAQVAGLNTSDFPKLPHSIGKENFVVSSKDLVTALQKTVFATSVDETRPIFTGVLFLFGSKYLSLVASDGFRLSQVKLEIGREVETKKIVIPRSGALELMRITQEEEGDVRIEVKDSENQVVFEIGNSIFSTRTLEGEFPNFEKIIPKTNQIKVLVDKEDFARALKLASIFARESSNIVQLKIRSKGISFSAGSAKSGKQENSIDAKVEGGEVEVNYNYRFIEEFLATVGGQEIQIEYNDVLMTGVFRDPEAKNFLHLIKPVKIQV